MQKKSKKNAGKPAKKSSVTNVPVKIGSTIKSEYRLENREFVESLSDNSGPFKLIGMSGAFPGYDINPANAVLFPWLSGVASSFEKYRFERLTFELVPRNPSTATGAVYLAVDYDWDDIPAWNAQEFMVNRGAVSADVWSPTKMVVDVERMNNGIPWRYVESLPRTGDSQRMAYGGFLMVAIAGTVASVSFDLYVSYDVRFSLAAIHHIDDESTSQMLSANTVANTALPFSGLPSPLGLPKVSTASAGVPDFGFGISHEAYRVPTSRKGLLTMEYQTSTAGQPPSLYATDTTLDVKGYDANGNKLSDHISSDQGYNTWQGPEDIALWLTNGAYGRVMAIVDIARAFAMYPTLNYLLPFRQSVSGRALAAGPLSTRFTEL